MPLSATTQEPFACCVSSHATVKVKQDAYLSMIVRLLREELVEATDERECDVNFSRNEI